MDNELWKTILGSSGITAVIVTFLTLGVKLWENRTAGTRAEDMDDSQWNAAYKSGAERHVLGYDVPIRQALLDLQGDVNKLRTEMGHDSKQFPELPNPRDFPLFPNRDHPEK